MLYIIRNTRLHNEQSEALYSYCDSGGGGGGSGGGGVGAEATLRFLNISKTATIKITATTVPATSA